MQLAQISVNLYTLRDHLKTPADFARSIARLGAIGFRSVQLSGVDLSLMTPRDFARICADQGITITATHEPSEQLLADPQQSIDRLGQLGVTATAYPFPRGIDFSSEAAVALWLRRLDEVTGLLAAAGITLAYHNHQHEFSRLGGRSIMERLFTETRIQGEPDIYWIQLGGGDPLAWTRRWADANRLPLIHLKDVRITATGETRYAELGAGGLDLPPIIRAAESGHCRSFIIEQDLTYERDAFEAVAESFAYLRDQCVEPAAETAG